MGIFDNIFTTLTVKPVDRPPRDLTPNVANRIGAHLAAKWPELRHIEGLWFSGSQVWSFLYDKLPPLGSDTDIFVMADARPVQTLTSFGVVTRSPLAEMMHRLGLEDDAAKPRVPPQGKTHYVPDGMDVEHERGSFDVWTTQAATVRGQLQSYPGSHSHCRSAFSFTEGLVVLPNEAAPTVATQAPVVLNPEAF